MISTRIIPEIVAKESNLDMQEERLLVVASETSQKLCQSCFYFILSSFVGGDW